MKSLLTIKDHDIRSDAPEPPSYEERRAARAVVFDLEGNIALLHATKKSYHKLPGGGIEKGEDIEQALRRELMEEIGCEVGEVQELGMIEEFRNKWDGTSGLHQLSHCYTAQLIGEKGANALEEDEKADGFEPVWMPLDIAIQTLESESSVENYEGKFIRLRDLTFLKEAAKTFGE